MHCIGHKKIHDRRVDTTFPVYALHIITILIKSQAHILQPADFRDFLGINLVPIY